MYEQDDKNYTCRYLRVSKSGRSRCCARFGFAQRFATRSARLLQYSRTRCKQSN